MASPIGGQILICLLCLLPAGIPLFALRTRKKEGLVYTALDKVGIGTNVLLSLLYAPTLLLGLFTAFLADAPDLSEWTVRLVGIAVAVGFLVPPIAFGGVTVSVAARRRGKRGLSFLVQFAGVLPLLLWGALVCAALTLSTHAAG